MLNVVTKILCNTFMSAAGFFITRNILKDKNTKLNLKNLLWILLIGAIFSLFTMERYAIINPILSCAVFTIMFKIVFDIKVLKAVVLSGISLILMFIAEMILSPLFFIIFQDVEIARTVPVIMICSNLGVALISTLLSRINIIKNGLNEFTEKLESVKSIEKVIFIILTIIVLSVIFVIMADVYKITVETIICMFAVIIFMILFTLYSKEQNEYSSLKEQYNQLFECVREFEVWIDKNEKNNHEYKNDLAVLETKISDPEIKKFIEEKLTQKMIINSEWIHTISDMPNGGMKGLIYYKIILAKNNKVELRIDISKQSKKHLKKLTEKEYEAICQLLGIYLDNALEAAKASKQRSMSIEFYEMKNELNIVIANSFSGKIELGKMESKGYTTKGSGHGKGLSYANEILKENNTLNAQNKICNDYYIQRIIVHNKKSHE